MLNCWFEFEMALRMILLNWSNAIRARCSPSFVVMNVTTKNSKIWRKKRSSRPGGHLGNTMAARRLRIGCRELRSTLRWITCAERVGNEMKSACRNWATTRSNGSATRMSTANSNRVKPRRYWHWQCANSRRRSRSLSRCRNWRGAV